jgi:hypothetical protein
LRVIVAMTTTHTSQTAFLWPAKGLKAGKQLMFLGLLFTTFSCSHTGPSDTGTKKRLRVSVGEIREISLSGRGDSGSELIGTSDNQEVVEVSRQQLAPAVDTLNRTKAGSTVFQIKGVTVGTANVIFSTKPMNQPGSGQTVRTYVVQVTAK